MVGGMSGGYPGVPGLTNTWPSYGAVTSGGYPASAYLGYNTGLGSSGQTSYSASALAAGSPYTGLPDQVTSLSGLVTSGGTSGPASGSTGLTSDSASPAGKHHHMSVDIAPWEI